MEEQFEPRPLLPLERLRVLQQRRDGPSLLRLTLHLGILILAAGAVMRHAGHPRSELFPTVVLALAWAGIFAPFHECTHQTAFAKRTTNDVGAWLTGIPFGLAPAVYRTFHFEHHRHTQDPERDPEIASAPVTALWPPTRRTWLMAVLGYNLVMLKLRLTVGFALRPQAAWPLLGGWTTHISDSGAVVRECRVLAAIWLVFLISALWWLPGGGWLLLALWLAHVLQTLWLMCEHTGLPHTGTILARTRTVESNAFARWWLWNMNYHAEHHAWPSIPWHQLPAAHREIADRLEAHAPGYIALHASVIAGRPLATPAA